MDFIGEFDSIQELLGTEIKVEKELVFVDPPNGSLLATNSHIPINTMHMANNPMLVGGHQLGGISTYSGLFNDDDDDVDDDDDANRTGTLEDAALLNEVLKFESPDSFEKNDDDFEEDFDIQFDNNEVKIEEPFDCDTLDRESMLKHHMNAIEEFNGNARNRNKRKNRDSSGPESRRLKEQRYQCDQCDAKYTKRRNLTIHIESKHLKLSHTCTICGSRTTNKDRFRQHMNKHTDKHIVQCSYCFIKFKDVHELVKHEQSHSKCHQSIKPDDESYPSFDEPKEQSTIDTEYTEQDSITIKEENQSEMNFEENGNGSTGVDEMIMEQFDKIMKQKGSDYVPEDDDFVLEEDEEEEEEEEEEMEFKNEAEPASVPNSIDEQFTLNESLQPTDEKRYQCNQCDASYTKRNNLEIHIQSKHLMLVFKCTICKHQTSNKDRFRRHMAKHTEVGLLKCRYCNIKFKTEADLIPHEESHADPTIVQPGSTRVKYQFRPNGESFECSACKKVFHRNSIKDHVKQCQKHVQSQQKTDPEFEVSAKCETNTTNPNKAFKCPNCPRVFGRTGDLSRHLKCMNRK